MDGLHVERRPRTQRRALVASAMAALWTLWATAPAQSAVPAPTDKVAVAAGEATDRGAPSSTETGQSPLDESFAPTSHGDWVRETRRQAWKDTRFDVQLRTYYLDRDRYDDGESQAWTLGGSVGLKTGYFRERFALGATGYTSQRLYGPRDKDGTLLLKPGQRSYTALGELYGEFLINPGTRLSIGRRGMDTPYLNRSDSRMTPNTFETVSLLGLYGGENGQPELRAGLAYVDAMKERNSEEFVSMATVADAPAGIERGVYVAGANYRNDDFSVGAIDYYSDDLINIFYTEGKYTLPLAEGLRLQFALQYSDQRAVGRNLLDGTDFSSNQWGGKAELGVGGALFSAAYARAGGDADMRSPWGGYPGYTSVQIEDFNRGGEDAWMLRAAYDFKSVEGLSVYGLWVDGSTPDDATQYAKREYDFNLQWAPTSGRFKGWLMRLRYAHVSQDDPADSELKDLRVMIYYDPPSL
ncbi:MAG: OprD family outer membrane porin [Pseudoxanthomonas sp.]